MGVQADPDHRPGSPLQAGEHGRNQENAVRVPSAHLHPFVDLRLRKTCGTVREPGVDLDRRPCCASAEVGEL